VKRAAGGASLAPGDSDVEDVAGDGAAAGAGAVGRGSLAGPARRFGCAHALAINVASMRSGAQRSAASLQNTREPYAVLRTHATARKRAGSAVRGGRTCDSRLCVERPLR
jgi:hypothetical protein